MTAKMIGSSAKPSLATKAAETGTLVEYVRDMMVLHADRLGGQGRALKSVGDALCHFHHIVRTSPRRLSATRAQSLVDCAKRACMLREEAGIDTTPKWHLMLHLVSKSWHHGNPAMYATFLDESYNGALAKMAKSCHRQTWHRSLLQCFRWASDLEDRRVRARLH